MDILKKLTEELGIKLWQTEAAVKLIDEGNTIPFISRYRKEATGSLNDEVLRNLNERLAYLRGLEDKKAQVLGSIEEQGKLTEELKNQILAAETLVAVDDLYRPYRPKRLKTGPWTSGPFYSALAAQRKADLRRRGSRKPRRMDSDRLRAWVLDSLRRGWSPELIEGRLKARYAGDPSMRISHECLYQWIYAKPQRALDLRQYLARGRKRRTRKKGRKAKGPRIPMRVPIADRPEAVGSRKGFGHFESDTVVGAAPSRRCMNTQVERRSRRLFARLVDDKSASATARAEYEIFKDMPPAARVDRTWDNGTEASLHMLVDEALGMLTYFADPYSCLCSISCCGFSHDDFSGLGRACRPRNGLNWMVLVSPPERTGKDYDQHAPSTVYPSFAAERGIRRVDRAENTCQRADGA